MRIKWPIPVIFFSLLPITITTTTITQPQIWRTTPPTETNYTFQQRSLEKVKVKITRQRLECVYAHTIIRSIHGLFALVWNEDLAHEAEKWAIYLAAKVGHLHHSNFQFSNGSYYGENIFSLQGTVEPARCHTAIHHWYKEIHNYDFDHPNEVHGVTGHFKQLVWRTSTQVGIGVAYNKHTLTTYIVARYTPPGNIIGKFDIDYYVKRMKTGTQIPSEGELLPSWAREPKKVKIKVKTNHQEDIPCKDMTDCSYYVSRGDCNIAIYKDYMMENCYQSCTKCKPGLPIDGGWTKWKKVSKCSVTCGGGIKFWYRFCTAPYPENGGKDCIGDHTYAKPCNTQECPQREEERNLTDVSDSCEPYSKMGYCYSGQFQEWMQQNCKKSCEKDMKDYSRVLKKRNWS